MGTSTGTTSRSGCNPCPETSVCAGGSELPIPVIPAAAGVNNPTLYIGVGTGGGVLLVVICLLVGRCVRRRRGRAAV